MTGVTLLTFDLDNTLWDVEPVILRADAAMVAWLDEHYPRWQSVGAEGLNYLRNTIASGQPHIRHDFTAMRMATVELALTISGHSQAQARAGAKGAFEVFYRGRNEVTLFEHVHSVLTELSRDYTLYALSNGNADIHQAGISGYFQQHLSAASVGFAKPHPRMFEDALALAGVEAGQAIHIGDHPVQDVAAAQAVGLKTIWVNYHAADWRLPTTADAEVRQFNDLPAAIARLASKVQV